MHDPALFKWRHFEADLILCAVRPPLFPSNKLPASVEALIANDRIPAPLPVNRRPGRPRRQPCRVLDPAWSYAQVDQRREQGRVVEVRRRIIFDTPEIITEILGRQQINTSYVERDNLTSRHSNGRLVRKTLCAPCRGHMTFPGLGNQHLIFHLP
jgi:hypothetical protein